MWGGGGFRERKRPLGIWWRREGILGVQLNSRGIARDSFFFEKMTRTKIITLRGNLLLELWFLQEIWLERMSSKMTKIF